MPHTAVKEGAHDESMGPNKLDGNLHRDSTGPLPEGISSIDLVGRQGNSSDMVVFGDNPYNRTA